MKTCLLLFKLFVLLGGSCIGRLSAQSFDGPRTAAEVESKLSFVWASAKEPGMWTSETDSIHRFHIKTSTTFREDIRPESPAVKSKWINRYDRRGRALEYYDKSSQGNHFRRIYTYTDDDRLRITNLFMNDTLQWIDSSFFDTGGKLVRSISRYVDGTISEKLVEYNSSGLVTKKTISRSPGSVEQTFVTYTEQGRVRTLFCLHKDAMGKQDTLEKSILEYDSLGQIVSCIHLTKRNFFLYISDGAPLVKYYSYRYSYRYNETGQIIYSEETNIDFKKRTVYTYGPDHRLYKEEITRNDSITLQKIHRYSGTTDTIYTLAGNSILLSHGTEMHVRSFNKSGAIIREERFYGPVEFLSLTETKTWRYDAKGREVEVCGNGYKVNYSYTRQGLKKTWTNMDNSGKLRYRYRYRYTYY